MVPYNYEVAWNGELLTTWHTIRIQQSIPKLTLYDLLGNSIDFNSLISSKPYSVLEFGSFT